MLHFFTLSSLRRWSAAVLLLLLLAPAARAQAPAWQDAFSGNNNQPTSGTSQARATALDAAGNVFVTGNFSGQVTFGSAQLTSAGSADVFVAKWNAAAGQWAWAVAGGGTGDDVGYGIAVSGGEVYVTGQVVNSGTLTTTTQAVQFGGVPLNSASNNVGFNSDVFVLRYSDGPSAPTYRWAVAGGGTSNDVGHAIALSGGEVYVTGQVANSGTLTTTSQAVQFGGVPLNSASTNVTVNNDVFVARYTDGTSVPTFRWAVAGGGVGNDIGFGIGVSGGEVYATGFVNNGGTLSSTTLAVQFGGVPLNSASTTGTTNQDVFVLRYTDGASAPTYRWAVAGGGTGNDIGYGLAVSGGEVYVTGQVTNSGTLTTTSQAVQFGGSPLFSASTTATANLDVFVARYTDGTSAPTYRWAVAGGGTGQDLGYGIAASGSAVWAATSTGTAVGSFGSAPVPTSAAVLGRLDPATGTWQRAEAPLQGGNSLVRATAVDAAGNVFVTGRFSGQVAFGSTRLVSAGGTDVLVAKWNATASQWAWAVAGGGTGQDSGWDLAVSGGEVYVTGQVDNSGTANASSNQAVQFGNTPLFSASTTGANNADVFVLRYTDGATAPTYRWAVAGGGTSTDVGQAIAVSGGEVYVTGFVTNSGTLTTTSQAVQFGGVPLNSASTNVSANSDVFVARYSDDTSAPTFRWAVAGGGTDADIAQDLAVSGGEVYVTGQVSNGGTATSSSNQAVQFGNSPLFSASTTPTINADVFVLRYTDGATAPTYRWALAGGGTGSDIGYGLAIGGQQVVVAGQVVPAARFGATTLANPAGSTTNFFARLTDPDLSPLPVQLTAFTATAAGPRAVRLAWATASELNSAYFEVQRSPDGRQWQALAQVPAAGHSSAPRRYAHLDAARPAGATYYRLRLVDQDGTAAYSPVRVLAGADGPAGGLWLYPNPAPGAATLAGAAPGTAVQVLDALGRTVATATADAAGTARLALPVGLAAGVYVVKSGGQAVRLAVD